MSERAKSIVYWVIVVVLFVVSTVLGNYCIRELGLEEMFKDGNLFGN